MVERVNYSESSNRETVQARKWKALNRAHFNTYMKYYMRFWRARNRIAKIEAMPPEERNNPLHQREILRVKKHMVKSWLEAQAHLREHDKQKADDKIKGRLEV